MALYTRVSTRDRGQDTANQVDQLRAFCAAQGWPIVAEYEDHDSGAKSERPGFRALMEAASRRQFDVVLFWSLDRFSREGVLETLQHLQRLTAYGVGWRSFTEQYLDSCGIFRDAVLSILATIAKQERVRIVERVNAGPKRAKEKGTKSGRAIGHPRRVFNRDHVAQMRRQGMSWKQIARKLGVGEGTVRRACQAYNGLHVGVVSSSEKEECNAVRRSGIRSTSKRYVETACPQGPDDLLPLVIAAPP